MRRPVSRWSSGRPGRLNGPPCQWRRPLERAVALSGEDITIFAPNAMASLGRAYAASGRVGEGISWLKQVLAGQDSVGIGYLHAVSLVQAGERYPPGLAESGR